MDFDHLPRHVAIIMDGNGRWAKKRGLPRTAGHAAGAENFRTIATYCKEIGLEYLTVYAFSTENWKRPAEEVSAIMGLLKKYLIEAIGKMERDRVKMCFFGDLSPLPQELRDLCEQTREISKHYEGVQVNICLNYGGRDELVRAAKAFALDCAAGKARSQPPDGSPVRQLSLLRRGTRPRPCDPAQRGGANLQFPALAVGLCGILFYRRALAGFQQDELNRALAAYQEPPAGLEVSSMVKRSCGGGGMHPAPVCGVFCSP